MTVLQIVVAVLIIFIGSIALFLIVDTIKSKKGGIGIKSESDRPVDVFDENPDIEDGLGGGSEDPNYRIGISGDNGEVKIDLDNLP